MNATSYDYFTNVNGLAITKFINGIVLPAFLLFQRGKMLMILFNKLTEKSSGNPAEFDSSSFMERFIFRTELLNLTNF